MSDSTIPASDVPAEGDAPEPGTAVVESAEAPASGASAATVYEVAYDVNVRSGPGLGYGVVGALRAGTYVSIGCQKDGQTITGPLGTSRIWDRIGSGRYVTDTYIRTGSDGYVAPRC
ncbi:SH3 domain-containing protein [Streptomyces sp. NPDC050560]|uniref:SH3 domain-containing protein n=1 Tax=Streptomyces sp. NPDC050560 TaxID=3365630 RepID=UPI00378ED6D1